MVRLKLDQLDRWLRPCKWLVSFLSCIQRRWKLQGIGPPNTPKQLINYNIFVFCTAHVLKRNVPIWILIRSVKIAHAAWPAGAAPAPLALIDYAAGIAVVVHAYARIEKLLTILSLISRQFSAHSRSIMICMVILGAVFSISFAPQFALMHWWAYWESVEAWSLTLKVMGVGGIVLNLNMVHGPELGRVLWLLNGNYLDGAQSILGFFEKLCSNDHIYIVS